MNARQSAKYWKKQANRQIKPIVIMEQRNTKTFGYSAAINYGDWKRIKAGDKELWKLIVDETAKSMGIGLMNFANWEVHYTTYGTIQLDLRLRVVDTSKPGLYDPDTVANEILSRYKIEVEE